MQSLFSLKSWRAGAGAAKGYAFEREFWTKVDVQGEDDCWLWRKAKADTGYGVVFGPDGKLSYAHRLAWSFSRGGKRPGRWLIRHRCDEPACCNPLHLFRGTHRLNTMEAVKRGRMNTYQGPKPFTQGERHGLSKLTDSKVRWARRNRGKLTLDEMMAKLGVSASTLSLAIRGFTWRHVQ